MITFFAFLHHLAAFTLVGALAYYFSSMAFIIKFGVCFGVAALSLMPTLEFLSWRKALRAGAMPEIPEKRLRMLQGTIHGEMMGIVVILLCAATMAKGGWI